MFVITKSDTINSHLLENLIKAALRDCLKVESPIYFISSVNKSGFSKLIEAEFKLKDKNKSYYVVGYPNTGKSSFINTL